MRANAETLAFVLPGLVHQFGNVLLTIQGNMLTVATANLGEAQRAVLEATARGGRNLEILRCLLGDAATGAADPVALLEQLAELVRVPMREATQLLELKLPAGPLARVDSADFVVLVVEALRHLVTLVPKGVRGRITLGLAGAPAGRTVVRVEFLAMGGELPFPLPVTEWQQALRARAQQSRAGASCRLVGQAIEIEWHGGAVSRHHEA